MDARRLRRAWSAAQWWGRKRRWAHSRTHRFQRPETNDVPTYRQPLAYNTEIKPLSASPVSERQSNPRKNRKTRNRRYLSRYSSRFIRVPFLPKIPKKEKKKNPRSGATLHARYFPRYFPRYFRGRSLSSNFPILVTLPHFFLHSARLLFRIGRGRRAGNPRWIPEQTSIPSSAPYASA